MAVDEEELAADVEDAKKDLDQGLLEGHRALIFCQMTSYLDMVVEHVL